MVARTKAGLKALRERVGLSQQDLAAMLGVNVRSVKRWEHEGQPWEAPGEAWERLEVELNAQREVVAGILGRAVKSGASMAVIDYYRDQAMMDECGEKSIPYGRANAAAMAAAELLESAGIEVEFRYPSESRESRESRQP